ncbi:DUF6479 family protein [Streptomyces sp. NPDC001985]|uniref:DUF6479 family protein n=1 Tax=Streptomyces sp. NPDC001985 TaxID=3154406 RepID=UPI003320061F
MTLAAEGGVAWLGPFLVGVVVVGLLIGMVVWRGRGRGRAPRPGEQPAPAARRAADRGTPREADDFGAEGERLSPHEMKGYGSRGARPGQDDRPDDPDAPRAG